ncbi:hypothetical protein HNP48_005889 [Acidovorax soli]|uniref:Uncharacterized protein n=1 Tax=Acidovorax soli TaxID=592050 RepID=A0A7X0PJP8_9BURK|nr:hypothetical protein [Acidovorax soli]MBB6563170.1 hypothetical protein [Acidovorax soli]
MKSMSNTSGHYGMLQGADAAGDSRVFGVAATIAVLVVWAVVGFKMAGPEIKAAVLSHLSAASQPMPAQSSASAPAPRADTPAHGLAMGEH